MALVSIKKYSEMCGCNIRTIKHRLEKKYIKTQKFRLPDNTSINLINTVKFPPAMIRAAGGGRKIAKINGKAKGTKQRSAKK